MEHSPAESSTLERDIIISREQVIAQYSNAAAKLDASEERNRQQATSTANLTNETRELRERLEAEKKKTESAEREAAAQLSRKLELLDLMEVEENKVKDLEAEVAKYKNDRKRKREEVTKVWERAERIKLEQ
jgi:hypothetical protein